MTAGGAPTGEAAARLGANPSYGSPRPRTRPQGPLGRILSVARYEMAWDLKKLWIYLSVVLMVILAMLSVAAGSVFIHAADSRLPSEHPVTFQERGLAPGTPWTVSFVGNPFLSSVPTMTTSSSITLNVTNGTWSFVVGSARANVTSYAASPSSGNVTVNGSPVLVPISFSASPPSAPLSYATAEAFALTSADALGGIWAPVASANVSGMDFTTPYTNDSVPNNGYCLLTGGVGAWPSLPAWTGNYSNGLEAAWQFELSQPETYSEDFVVVEDGQAINIGYAAGSNCTFSLYNQPELSQPPIDSPHAALALAGPASAFLTAHAQADSSFSLGVGPSGGPVWNVVYTTCGPGGGGSGARFEGEVNAVSGAVLRAANSNGTCAPPPPPVSPTLPRSGPIQSASSPLPFEAFGPLLGGAIAFANSFTSASFAANWWENSVLLMGIFGFWILLIGGASSFESIARERDKGTLGALLSQPLRREDIYLGKFLAKIPFFLLISGVYVGVAVAGSWVYIAPQANLAWAVVAVLDLTLAFLFFSSVALLLGCVFRRTKVISGFLWLLWIGGFLALYEMFRLGLGTLPYAYVMPGQSVWLPFAGARAYLFDPNGTAHVTYLPQVLGSFFSWGLTSTADFALLSVVGLTLDIGLFLGLGIVLFRRVEVKE